MNPILQMLPLGQAATSRVFRPAGAPTPAIVAPGVHSPVDPPVMLPGQLDRVTGTDEHSPLEEHLIAARETVSEHMPLLRWTLRNALVSRNGFVSGKMQERYDPTIRRRTLLGHTRRVKELRYCIDYVSWRYFGHWLMDAIPKSLIDPELGDLWLPHAPGWSHAPEITLALGLTPLTDKLVYADRLHVYHDIGQSDHKAARYAQIRARLHTAFGSKPGNDLVFLRRGSQGARREIANEAALMDQLAAKGWVICDVDNGTAADLHRRLHAAKVVVSVEGSHMNHAQFALEPGSVVMALCPADRFGTNQLGRCRANGLIPALLVMPGTAEAGYHVDADEIFRTVDLALASPTAR